MPTLSINGRICSVEKGATILEAARSIGVHIPTLCHHEALEPWGACRLCMVDMTKKEWDGWSKVVIACMAVAEDGLIINTKSDRVVDSRKVMLELLLARCPDTPRIRHLAAEYGVTKSSYEPDPNPTDCILCGLCTRVCDAYATSAISSVGRGIEKTIGTFAEQPPEDCIGCGACAFVCPTDCIKTKKTKTGFEIWDRFFSTHHCLVDQQHCIGCGSCEEACPWSIPRVVMRTGMTKKAFIETEHCRGCGACIASCPTGAIQQKGVEYKTLEKQIPHNSVVVFACERSDLHAERLPASVRLVKIPCTGRVSVPLLLDCMRQGNQGVLVLGRHQATCRLNGAEDLAEKVVNQTRRVLTLMGIQKERVQFVDPKSGYRQPEKVVQEFMSSCHGTEAVALEDRERSESNFALLKQLSSNDQTSVNGDAWIIENKLSLGKTQKNIFYIGSLPILDILAGEWIKPIRIPQLIKKAVSLVALLGIDNLGITTNGAPDILRNKTVYTFNQEDIDNLQTSGIQAKSIVQLICEQKIEVPLGLESQKVAYIGEKQEAALISALAGQPLFVGPDPIPISFSLSSENITQAEECLQRAEQQGAKVLLISDPYTFVRWALINRHGAWRTNRVQILMPHDMVWLLQNGLEITPASIDRMFMNTNLVLRNAS